MTRVEAIKRSAQYQGLAQSGVHPVGIHLADLRDLLLLYDAVKVMEKEASLSRHFDRFVPVLSRLDQEVES